MIYFSNLKNALLNLPAYVRSLTCNRRVKRHQSFGPNESLPVSVPPTAPEKPPLPSPSPRLRPLMVEAQGDATAAPTPAPPLPSRSIAELAIPAALSVAIYGSIPSEVQRQHPGVLYALLVAFIALTVFTSLGAILYSLARPDGRAAALGEMVKERLMAMAIGFVLVAFTLRVLLVLPLTSLGLAGCVVLVGAAVMAVLFFLSWKDEEIRDLVDPDPAPDYSVENPS